MMNNEPFAKLSALDANRLYDISVDMLGIANFAGYFTHLNPAWERVLGYTHEELMRYPYLEFIHPDDRVVTVAEAQKLATTSKTTLFFENRYLHKDGFYVWLSWNAIAHAEERLIYFSARDVTQRKKAEAHALALEKERTRAETLYKLIQAISHDLRTPLTTINTSTYLLKTAPNEMRRQHHMNIIEDQTIHLSNLIESILEIARLDTLQTLNYSLTNLSLVLNNLHARFQSVARDKNLNLTYITEDSDILLWANEADLGNALGEIIKNAIQFTHEEGSIVVRTHCTAEQVIITVEDSGIGMSEDVLARAFERFFRADEARSTDTGGVGLGLTLAQKIIELHNGHIDVQSSEQVGTICEITLPLHVPQ